MSGESYVLVTGGAGFIGSNLAQRLVQAGERVAVFDNLSRRGAEANLAWLERSSPKLSAMVGDVRDPAAVDRAVRGASFVYHLAAQVAVTTSLARPLEDFETNARGTLNLLETVRGRANPPPVVFTSTSKVYGTLAGIAVSRAGRRYLPSSAMLREHGISEEQPLEFLSPYGCSKGAADQYVRDFARTLGVPAVVLRTSCVYGPRQFGSEDQGWVAHFVRRAIKGEPITIYGDGMQVRDVLFVDDLVDALLALRPKVRELSGAAYNMGGGAANATSLLELVESVEPLVARRPSIAFGPWRPSDQRYYVTDFRAFAARTGWRPRVGLQEGVARLHEWTKEALADPALAKALEGATS